MSEVFRYIYKDMIDALQFLPWGILVGGPMALMVLLIGRVRGRRTGGRSWKPVPLMLLCVYMGVMLAITYLARESGSRKGVMDLELLSTWGINSRNNAFVVENVLLFIPYGFLLGWSFRWAKNIINCVFAGLMTSLLIETMQLLTRRGYFQIDDIWTNTLGMLIGSLICTIGWLMGCGIGRRGKAPGKK